MFISRNRSGNEADLLFRIHNFSTSLWFMRFEHWLKYWLLSDIWHIHFLKRSYRTFQDVFLLCLKCLCHFQLTWVYKMYSLNKKVLSERTLFDFAFFALKNLFYKFRLVCVQTLVGYPEWMAITRDNRQLVHSWYKFRIIFFFKWKLLRLFTST